MTSLLNLADLAGDNPFDLHDHLNSMLAALPPHASARLVRELAALHRPVVDQALAGFILSGDDQSARTAAECLAAAAGCPVESALVERLVRLRPWLPQDRQASVDAAIRALRRNALPPVKIELPQVLKCYLSICDGAGVHSAMATLRAGRQYMIVTVMFKTSGVVDAMVLPDLPKSAMDEIVREMKASVPVVESDLAGISKTLALAISENLASGKMPPFKLVELAECLGLGPVHPDPASPAEIVAAMLADLAPEQIDAKAAAKAHAAMRDGDLKYQWFEGGEEVENLLYPIRGRKQRIAKILKTLLPQRRAFWLRQCAISALVLRGNGKTRDPFWMQLALVGRDLASAMPLEQMPLMQQIAESTVLAFEDGM